ncbi:MAG: diguanylate cyclase [Candidatus Omnitrophica bacterium]|jgi:GGDEF domain-containing protein|nr:diguanylate cyclase [Candidatus Omnitrophota bacterium]
MTLKNRIIILLVTFTILTITLFVGVQLFHELKIINKFNTFRATIVSLILTNTWEKIIGFNLLPENQLSYLEKKLTELKESEEITQAYILDKEAKIIFSTNNFLQGQKGNFDDIYVVDKINKGVTSEKEIFIDKNAKFFFKYVFLKGSNNDNYVVKLSFSLSDMHSAYMQVYQPAFTIGAIFIFLNIILGIFFSRLIIVPIKVFNAAAKIIASGRLDLRVNISTNDELEQLARTFNFMTEELAKMKAKAEDANPLTKLPGNIVIREEIEKRINEDKKFMVIYCDLDNFKAFNDKYGIAKGDDAIKLTGQLFKDAIKNKGNNNDFIGHEGGDDFILLTTPDKAQLIADYITLEFDKRVLSLYDAEDLERGFIVAQSRDGAIHEFPIMTISLAGVTNEHRLITSYAEVTNIAAEIKKKAKKLARSCFVLDQRKDAESI